MSADLSELKDAIYQWLDDETAEDVETIEAKPNIRRPSTEYVTYDIIAIRKTGQDSHFMKMDTSLAEDEFELGGQRVMTLSVTAYGENSEQIMLDLQQSLEKQSVIDQLSSAGLAPWNEPQLNDISIELETGIERRMNMDVFLGFTTNVVETLGLIETIEIEGTVETQSGEEIITNEIIDVS